MRCRRLCLFLLSCAVVLIFPGCSESIPKNFPDIVESDTATEASGFDITPVNFYFDNIENTKAIKYSSLIASSFMKSVINTNRSTFSTTDYHLELENGKYVITENSQPIEDVYLSDSFYISESTEATRKNSGIMNLLFNEDNSSVNMDEVNVIFTDLSEKDIDKAARLIRETYLASEEYNVCLLSISMETKEAYDPFYITASNNNVIKVDAKGLNDRFYYLIMLGPTAEVSAYVHCLKANLNEGRLIKNADYYITDYDYIQHEFSVEDDLNTDSISYCDANAAFDALYSEYLESQETTQAPAANTDTTKTTTSNTTTETTSLSTTTTSECSYKDENEVLFKTHIIRLDSLSDYYKQEVWHLKYNKKNTDGVHLDPRGYQGNSLDFSLQVNMDLSSSLRDKKIHYITLEQKSDGSIIYTGLPGTRDINNTDAFFAFGSEEDVKVYSIREDTWTQLNPERISRFFKEFTTEDGRLNIISDNTDEGGIHNLYIVVPVYQIVVRKNYTPNWIDGRAYIIGQDHNGLDRYRKTNNLRQFYCMLFGINIENKENDIYVDETKVEKNRIGYVRILISDI